ncbi:MAG: TonB-dependent receptor plug domain-containing protein [Alistipes sp.]|jgi:TonB-dependent SusC/RagA subfamily outer membrane receptor|nr:TonB-dependent receptor plug domain-containing protein [Alistipes sp.]
MSAILTYAMQTVACGALFVMFYRVVLQGRTSFRTARRYLLASPVVAAVIPALDIPLWRVAPLEIPLVPTTFDAEALPVSDTVAADPVDLVAVVLWALWGVGLAVLAFAMVRQMVNIASIRRRAEIHPADGFSVAVSGEVGSPFSFLGTVFIGRDVPAGEVSQIVTHEASHIRHRHCAEKLAMEVAKNLQWFNPFAWWAARLLGEVHEFEADRDVLDGGSTVEEYLPIILRQTFGYIPELSVGLGDSLTKKRFLMMKNKMKPARNSWLRVAGVLPLATGAMLLFSFTSHQPEIIYTETEVPATVEAIASAAEVTVQSPEEPKPLIILDGKEITGGQMSAIDPNTIERVEVLKDDSAVEKYGEKAAKGVIVITSKLAAEPSGTTLGENEIVVVGYGTQRRANGTTATPLVFVDGREVTNDQFREIDPDTIESISVLKDASATSQYGDGAKDGVIIVTMKRNNAAPTAAPTEVIDELKQRLRAASVTSVTYTIADGETVTMEIE